MNSKLFLIMTLFHKHLSVTSIKCFECILVRPDNLKTGNEKKLCDGFDFSEDSIVDCKNSTFCRKSIFNATIGHPLVGVERACASQLYDGLRYENSVWYDQNHVVHDAYEEGCSTAKKLGLRTVDITNCYCQGDLCNSSKKTGVSTILMIFVIMSVWFKKSLIFHTP